MMISKACLAFAVCVAIALCSGAVRAAKVPEIGAHHPVLIVEKNVNPQNKMVVSPDSMRTGGS